MKAVVMAGGEGTRLRPLTCNLPKPMVPVFDKPVMEYSLELLKEHGITDIAMTLQYMPQAITGFFGNGRDRGLNIRYYIEDSPLGTAGSVYNARDFLDETFIVISGDALTDFSLSKGLAFHKEKGALATLILTRVESPLEYGLVLTDGEGWIRRFLEKPSWGEVFSDTVNTGIYILEPEVLEVIEPGVAFDFSRDVFPRLLAEGKPLLGCILDGYWCDIGNHPQYRQVHFDILDGIVKIEPEGQRIDNIILASGSRVSPGAYLEGPAYIGPYCQIGAGARILPYTVLGRGSVVGAEASLKRTVVWSGCSVGARAELRGATIGKGVHIDKRAMVLEGAVVGDDSILEEEVVVKPEIKIWPQKVIEAKRVVAESVVWADKVPRNLFTRRGIVGKPMSGLTPEKMARLGRALGSYLPVNSRLVLGTDWSVAGQVARHSLLSGLILTGIKVWDVGRVPLPTLRFAVRVLGANSGVYAGCAGQPELLGLRIVNSQGADLTKSEERKIENTYYREEYRLVNMEGLQEPTIIPGIITSYLNAIWQQVEVDNIRRGRFRVVAGSDITQVSQHLVLLLDRLGCDLVRVDGLERQDSLMEKSSVLSNIINHTVRYQANIGIFLEEAGQKMTFVTPEGKTIQEERLTALITQLFAPRFSRIYLPVSAPITVEQHMRRLGREVIRTRSFSGEFMQELLKAEEHEQLHLYTDGFFALAKILELMAQRECSFNDLLEEVPRFYFHRRDIPVSWEQKGRVIRKLSEKTDWEGDIPLQGIRIISDQGNSLILPDEDYPICRIYSESFSQEIADSLTEFYTEKIKQICQEEE